MTSSSPRAALFTVPHGSPICLLLFRQIQLAQAIGNPILAGLLGQTFINLGRGGAVI